MIVSVVESGHDDGTVQLDDPSGLACQAPDRIGAADGGDAFPGYGNRLDPGIRRVGGEDFSADENDAW